MAKTRRFERHKKRIHRLKKHPFVVPVLTLLVLFFITLAGLVSFNATTIGPADARVVHVFVDGKETTLPTRAATVGELLDKLGVDINEGDVVEPGLDAQILEDDYTVNIYRARPVTVVDGDKKTTILSAQQSPRALAREAGITLYPEDNVEVSVPDDVLKEGVVGEKFTVDRAVPVKLVLFGQPVDIRTHAQTVGELLQDKDIDTSQVTVLPPLDTPITPNAVIFVTSPDKNIITVEEEIPMPIETVDDPSLAAGTTQIREAGSPGKKVVIYEVDKTDPAIKTPLQEIIAQTPVKQVVARGTKVTLTGSKADWMAAAGINPSQYVYVDYIIGRESGWNPASVSANRCIGLGQRCNPQILISACPNWQSDPVCQLQHFTSYAEGRYGSWQGAYSFWQTNHWW